MRFLTCFCQGTWQFMAANLVESSGIKQTFIHDLESFFWVLLWIALNYAKTTWTIEKRSSFLATTFSPDVYLLPGGGATGGDSKKKIMKDRNALTKTDSNFDIPDNTPLRSLLRKLHQLLRVRHDPPPMPEEFDTEYDGQLLDLQVKVYERGLALLNDHQAMLSQFRTILGPQNRWPADDKASLQPTVLSIAEENIRQTSSKRLRSAYEDGVHVPSSSSKRHQA